MYIEIPGSFRVVEKLPTDHHHVKQTLADADAAAYPGFQCYVTLEKKYYRYLIVNENDLIRQEVAYVDIASLATAAQLAEKADAAAVTAALADKSSVNHHHNALYATIEALADKADIAAVNFALEAKANSADVNAGLNLKINTTVANNTFATKEEVALITGTDPETLVTPEDLTTLQTTLEGQISQKADTSHNHDGTYAPENHNHTGTYVDITTHNNDLDSLNQAKADIGHHHNSIYRQSVIPIDPVDIESNGELRFLDSYESGIMRSLSGRDASGAFCHEDYVINHTTNVETHVVNPIKRIIVSIHSVPVRFSFIIKIPYLFDSAWIPSVIPKGYVIAVDVAISSIGWPYSIIIQGENNTPAYETLVTHTSSGGSVFFSKNYLFVFTGIKWRMLLQ